MESKEQKIKKLIQDAKKLLTPDMIEKFRNDLTAEQFNYLTSIFLIEFSKTKTEDPTYSEMMNKQPEVNQSMTSNPEEIEAWKPQETIKTWDGEKFIYVKKAIIDKKA